MLAQLQNTLLLKLYPLRKLAWPLMILGLATFPVVLLVAIMQPSVGNDVLFAGWVAGLGALLKGALLTMSRAEPLPKGGLRNQARRLWETLVFWLWLVSLLVFLSLAIKIISLS
ncbi:MAG: hypothetical protein ACX931_02960 [Saccharospirillum sp.]